jgi:hypothetical protein
VHVLLRSGVTGVSQLMGKHKRPWQETKYVLSYFGKTVSVARKNYVEYVKKGFNQGRRPGLTGGGLIRSLGGWRALKKIRLKGQDRVKSDARILVDELGLSRTELAKCLGMTQPGVGYAVNRGAQIAQDMNYKLIK